MTSTKLTFDDLHPLHFAILDILPKEGDTLGYHRLAKTVRQVTKELNKHLPENQEPLITSEVSGALRSLKASGFALNIKLVGSDRGWQSTSLGIEALSKRGNTHGSNTGTPDLG